MLFQRVVRLRAFYIAALFLGLALDATWAADSRQNPLVGLSREQLLEKLGEPRNTMVAGNREVLLFERERVILRDGVVSQVERLPVEPVRRPPPAAVVAQPSLVSPPDSGGTLVPAVQPQKAPAAAAESDLVAGSAANAGATLVPAGPAAPDPDAPLAIKVRSAGTPAKSAPKSDAGPAANPSAPAVGETKSPEVLDISVKSPAGTAAVPASMPNQEVGAAQPPPNPTPATNTPVAPAAGEGPVADAPKTEGASAMAEPATPAAAGKQPGVENADDKAKKIKARIRRNARRALEEGELEEPTSFFTGQTYIIAFLTIGGGIAYLIWRQRQRQLELAATAVSHTPFTPPTNSAGGGPLFKADFLAKLEWKKFEELVAAYYSKTGVVAVRTKTGPASAVHVKISWKGEPRPFACVQCLANPVGLVDATPIQGLVAALAADEIRRGYVVTNGKFNVPARDLAEEKHITLLPGDIFLEKLNALPDAARSEIMTEISAGDLSTPTCPKCDVKMVPGDGENWRCPNSPKCDAVLPMRK